MPHGNAKFSPSTSHGSFLFGIYLFCNTLETGCLAFLESSRSVWVHLLWNDTEVPWPASNLAQICLKRLDLFWNMGLVQSGCTALIIITLENEVWTNLQASMELSVSQNAD